MKFLMTSTAIAAMAFVPTTASAQLIGGLDNSTLLGGAVGAGLGGAIGSNLAGSGQRDEGTAIGAVVGGLAGAAYGNSRSSYAGNPYAGQLNPGFNGRSLVGTGIGAGLGGVIGSNLAGSGQRQEGTAIGAVLGGAAGYALSNRGSSRNGGGAQGGYGYGGYSGGGYAGGYAPAPVNYGPAYVTPSYPAVPMMSGPRFINSGQYVSGPVIPVTRYHQPAVRRVNVMSQPRTVYVPNVTYAAPNLRLAGPPIRPTVVRHTVRTEHMPIARAERIVIPASTYSIPALSSYRFSSTSTTSSSSSHHVAPAPQRADCPAGTTWQSNGTCLEKSYGGYSAPMTSRSVTLPGTFKPSVSRSVTLPGTFKPSASRMVTLPGTFEPSISSVGSSTMAGGYSASSSSYSSSSSSAPCPAGSTRQSGICVTPGTTSYSTTHHSSAPAVTYRETATTYHVPETVVRPQQEYCYAGSSKRYDSLGNEIKSGHGKHCRNH